MKKFIIIFTILYSWTTFCSQHTELPDHDDLKLTVVIHKSQAVCLHPQQQCDYTLERKTEPAMSSVSVGEYFYSLTVLKNNKSDNFVVDRTRYRLASLRNNRCEQLSRNLFAHFVCTTRDFYTTSIEERHILGNDFSKAYSKFFIREFPFDHMGKSFHFKKTDLQSNHKK